MWWACGEFVRDGKNVFGRSPVEGLVARMNRGVIVFCASESAFPRISLEHSACPWEKLKPKVDMINIAHQLKCRHSHILAIAAVIVGSTTLQGCNGGNGAEKTGAPNVSLASDVTPAADAKPGRALDKRLVSMSVDAVREAGVTLADVAERELDSDVNVTGEVLANANTQTHVTTPVIGRVTKILVSIGDHIAEGKPLMLVRSTDIQQAESDLLQGAQQVRSDLKQALIQIDCDTATADAQLKLDEKIFQRLKGLYEEQIASKADFQAAETNFYKDQIALTNQHQKRQATVSLSNEKMKLVTEPAKTKLRLLGVSDADIAEVMKTELVDPLVPVLAPEDGIIVERLVNVGELIDPSKPLFTIGDFHSVWLKADVFEKDIPKLRLGQPIELAVDSFPDQSFTGKLDYIANQVDGDTRTLLVRAEISNPQGLLRPKMFARMKILVGQQRVLAIPTAAVQDTRNGKVVYVGVDNDTFEERKIKVGPTSGDYVEVLEGLRPGEKVVTQGSFDLRAAAVRTYSS
jgi:membrane fusion protein, heavy metal efflux system